MELGRFQEARILLQEAIELTDATGQRAFEAEVHRILGELNRRERPRDIHAAETSFRKALDVAHIQEAKGFELRAAMSLARVWQSQGRRTEARDLLAPLYNWFTEGFHTRDLKQAGALLDELR
jgi:predicted ATPase